MQGIAVDIAPYLKDSDYFRRQQYPMAIAKAFKNITERARDNVRAHTRAIFNLHSDYIPDGIKNTPNTPGQLRSAERAIERFGDIQGTVFLRGSGSPKRSLDFMVDHLEGADRKSSTGGVLAIPAQDLSNYSYKTGRGITKKQWKPETVLKYYNQVGPNKSGSTIKTKRRGRGKAFIMRTKPGNTVIVRRVSSTRKPLEFLYAFKKSVKIDKVWKFDSIVYVTVSRHYDTMIAREINKIR